jgi:hypothetical protein
MKIDILSLKDTELWHSFFYRLPEQYQDIYFLPEYHHLYHVNGDGEAKLFIATSADRLFFYPFMLKHINHVGGISIDGNLWDIESVYGYSGPLLLNPTTNFINNSFDEFDKYCQGNNIVTEFVRFHPLIRNHIPCGSILGDSLENIREYIWVNLTKGIEWIWKKSFSNTNRNMIRKAQKNGVTIKQASNWDEYSEFVSLYLGNMHRVRAAKKYYFSPPYFEGLYEFSKRYGVVFLAILNDEVIGASIFLKYRNYAHYHLSAANEIGRKHGVSNYLLFEGISWAIEEGALAMHLGGGMSGSKDDGLFKFKAEFSPLRTSFHVGKKIHDMFEYQQLIQLWRKSYPSVSERHKSIFQIYRINPDELG